MTFSYILYLICPPQLLPSCSPSLQEPKISIRILLVFLVKIEIGPN